MRKDIPKIKFNAESETNFGFEIVPIEKIKQNKLLYDHNPELPHQLKFYNLIFFTEGEGKHFIDFNWYPIKKNNLLYLTKDQINAFDFSENLKGFCLLFTEDFFIECFSSLPNRVKFRLFNPELFSPILEIPEESDFKNYFNLLKKELLKTVVFNQKAIVKSLFIILTSKAEYYKKHQTLHIKSSSKIKLLQKFTTLLDQKHAESRSADFYATELTITYKHLNTICKELLHKTAKNVIDDFIILQAKRNLINSTIKSNQLAYKLGFEDPTNFAKYFKKHTGLTPISFKNQLKTF